MKENIHHKYDCLNKLDQIIKDCNDSNATNLILDMKDLILYQMHEIRDQRMEIISFKHKNAWKHYDKPISEYDSQTRSYRDNFHC
jgi:protein tyrosine phosphatase